jgi:hypothetical protein
LTTTTTHVPQQRALPMNTFHVVPELPHQGSVLFVDEGGTIHTYVSRAVSFDVVMADLSWVFTRAVRTGDYVRASA